MRTKHTDGGKTFVRSTGKKKKVSYKTIFNDLMGNPLKQLKKLKIRK